MTRHDDRVYLKHIDDAITKINEYIHGVTHENFLGNTLLTDAVIRNLEIIGEASNRISMTFIEENPDISFRAAIAMRNQLAHGYDDVDIEVVWSTITEDLPQLQSQISALI